MVRAFATLLLILPAMVGAQDKLSPEELAKSAREMARLKGEIQRSIDEYNKRPRRLEVQLGLFDDTMEGYVRPILEKIERLGTYNYPFEARGKIYGKVSVRFEIYSNGTLTNAKVIKSSGHEVLDNAAIQAIRLASPAYPFPSAVKEKADILVLRQTFDFTNSANRQ